MRKHGITDERLAEIFNLWAGRWVGMGNDDADLINSDGEYDTGYGELAAGDFNKIYDELCAD